MAQTSTQSATANQTSEVFETSEVEAGCSEYGSRQPGTVESYSGPPSIASIAPL
jgi:hypothetical protein